MKWSVTTWSGGKPSRTTTGALMVFAIVVASCLAVQSTLKSSHGDMADAQGLDEQTVQQPSLRDGSVVESSMTSSASDDSAASANDGATVSENGMMSPIPGAGNGQQNGPRNPATTPTYQGRPLKKLKTMTMLVTAYSPDERSCGVWSDLGTTASGVSIKTNGMMLVAADTEVLPFSTIISVPGYHAGQPVPVLDRGGKIKGNHIDLLFPTHEEARAWGVKRLVITVWGYAQK